MTPTLHKDETLGILYHRMWQIWYNADAKSLRRKSELLYIFQERMKAAGYEPAEIAAIERKALRELDRLNRPIETVFVPGWWGADGDTERLYPVTICDCDPANDDMISLDELRRDCENGGAD